MVNFARKNGMALLFLSALIIMACNVFNPSGEGDLPESSEGRVSVGQSHLQNQKWEEAMEAFKAAIEADSTNSFAYFGYAKAVRFKFNLNGLSLSEQLTGVQNAEGGPGQVPFLGETNEVLNQYLGATTELKPVLSKLVQRDSLSRLWSRANTVPIDYDKITQTQIDFINSYLASAASGTPGFYTEDQFPLMDGVINYEKITPDLTLILLVHTFVGLKDLNSDGVIDENDNIGLVEDVLAILDSGLSVENLAENLANIAEDPETAEDVNALIDKISSGTQDVATMISLAGDLGGDLTGGADSTGAGGELTGEVEETIANLGNTVVFYKFNDSLDNDGDGCVDEEAFDQVDNDGDGLVDEDANTNNKYVILNPLTETVSARTDSSYKSWANSSLGTVLSVSASDPLSGSLGGVIDWNDPNFWVADTISNEDRFKMSELIAGGTPPYTGISAANIEWAKSNIGGCWRYY